MSIIKKLLQKKESKEFLLILSIKKEIIYATVVQIEDDETKILGTGQSNFTSEKDEVEAVDIAISSAERDLPEDILVEKVIFALPTNYIEEDSGKIYSKYQSKLDKIGKELGLKLHGFVTYPQVLANYLELQEETSASAIFIGIEKDQLSISLIRVGKVKQNILIPRSESITKDIESVLPNFSVEILPSRIIFYDGESDIEELRASLLKYSWHKHSSFLHTPKIETISTEKLNIAVTSSISESFFSGVVTEEIKSEKPEEEKISFDETHIKDDVSKFGFVKNKDIAETKKKIPEKEIIESDIKDRREKTIRILNKLKNMINFLKKRFSNIPISFSLPIIWPLLALISIIFLTAVYWFYPKANVYLIVYPSISTKQIEVLFITKEDRRTENIIVTRPINAKIEGSKKTSTTGTTQVGKPARGTIIIYNKTTGGKTFPKGIVLKNGDLSFTIDSEVSIASASDTGESLEFGKTETNVTASKIGPEGNLPEGSVFVFKDFPQSQYYAKSIENFSGGTSREISTVSKKDQEKLLNELIRELEKKGRQKLVESLDTDQSLIESTVNSNIVSKKFSHKPGDETREVSLSLNLEISALSFNDNDLSKVAERLDISPPKGFIIESKKTDIINYDATSEKDGNIKATVNISIYSRADIDLDNIKSKIAGKRYRDAAIEASKESHVAAIEIVEERSLPIFGNRLPSNGDNLSVRLKSK